LYWAAHGGHTNLVDLLVQVWNADLDKADNNETTPLMAAIMTQKTLAVKALLKTPPPHTKRRAASLQLEDSEGDTAMDIAKMLRENVKGSNILVAGHIVTELEEAAALEKA
jgi:ankyrin repeat protein